MAALPGLLSKLTPKDRTWEYMKLFEAAKRARLPYDKETWLNVAFYLGEQYVEWSDAASSIRRIPRMDGMNHVPRPVSNKIMHFVQSELANVLQTRPTKDVLPATEDPNDISNANVANAYLEWLQEPQIADFDGELAEAALWALCSTEGYLKWIWNPRLDNGSGSKGRPDIVCCSPLDVYPDPYAKKFSNCRYIIHSQFMDVEQVYDIYNVEMSATDVERADPTKVALMREMGMAPVLQGVYVNELWMKPCRRYPDGLYVVWSNHKVLVEPGPFPYEHKRLPFTQIGSIGRPGTLHYTSAVTFLRTPQMELNKIHAQMIQTREAFANPKWFIPSELEMEEDPDDSPNQILRGNTQGGLLKPLLITPTQMPPNDAGAWVAQEMMDIVGLHEVSSGQVPGRVEAAKAISQLQDQDDARLNEMLRTIEASISEGFYQLLMLARQYHQGDQMVATYSREGVAEVKKFLSTAISPGMRIRVTMGSGLSRSRAARTEQLMTMWQNQIISDKELMAELMDLPISSVSPDNAFDIRLARNENYTMADGVPITPNSWDNHDIHRREHNNYRKTHEYQMLDSHIKTMYEYHVQMHDQLEVQSLGHQLQIQQLSAAVANGVGFSMPAPGQPGPAAPGAGGPPGGAQGGAPAPAPSGGPQGHTIPQLPPTAPPKPQPEAPPPEAGVRDQVAYQNVRSSPQGTASYLNRYGGDLAKV